MTTHRMSPAILTLQTEDTRHQLPCPAAAKFTLGSGEEADIALDGVDIPEHHCTLERIGERRFYIAGAAADLRCTVNGVTAPEIEVEVPFRFVLGGDVIDFDLEVETQAPASRRRDYLLGTTSLRERVKVVRLPSVPVQVPEGRLRRITDDTGRAASPVEESPVPRARISVWRWLALVVLLLSMGLVSDPGRAWLGRVTSLQEKSAGEVVPGPAEVSVAEEVVPMAEPPPPKVIDPKVEAARAATDLVAAFLQSWNDEAAAGVLGYVSPALTEYFEMATPTADVVLRSQEELRARWPQRMIQAFGEPVATALSETKAEVLQMFAFELRGMNREARGTGELRCAVERNDAKEWRIVKAADRIDLRQALPDRGVFSKATSLRELEPVLSMEEKKKMSVDHLDALIEAGNHKLALQGVRQAETDFPEESFWRFSAERICEDLARTLFADGQLPDPSCIEEVVELSDSGLPSAMLLHGHFLRAGYGMPRSEPKGEMLYRRAFDKAKSREARFYFAESLFVGGEIEKASAIALATMVSSEHPLEAYLAAHLLWKKAELDPSLWQKVYETVARVAEVHPPARNLAGLVLLKHGQTRKEREAGFSLIRQAAEAGVVEAMKNLSMCYEVGDGCDRSATESEKWRSAAVSTKPPQRKHFSEWRGE